MLRILVGGILALGVGTAFAEGAAPPKPAVVHQAPCVADARRFCNDVPYGGGRRLACLARHWSQLEPTCRPRLKLLQAMFEFGQEQHKKTMAVVAKERAEAAKRKVTPPANKSAEPPQRDQNPG